MNENPEPMPVANAIRPGLLRRLAAIFYDGVIVFGMALLVTALVVVPLGMGMDLTAWEQLQNSLEFRIGLRILLIVTIVGFHIWFWTHGGQSLGMRAWRLQVVRDDGLPLSLGDAVRRYLAALISALPLGLGFLWSLFDRDRLAWHDRWSKTRLLLIKRDR